MRWFSLSQLVGSPASDWRASLPRYSLESPASQALPITESFMKNSIDDNLSATSTEDNVMYIPDFDHLHPDLLTKSPQYQLLSKIRR